MIALPREFMSFNFSYEEDIEKVMEQCPWFLGKKGLVLKKWYKGFRPKIENINLIPTWINLPNLPPEYWHMSVIIEIACNAKEFISIDRAIRNRT